MERNSDLHDLKQYKELLTQAFSFHYAKSIIRKLGQQRLNDKVKVGIDKFGRMY